MLKVVLLWYGRMGQALADAAPSMNISVVSIIDRAHPAAHFREISASSLCDGEVVIDFTNWEGFLDRLEILATLGISVVSGSTGWQNELSEQRAKKIIQSWNIGFLWSSNFSLGVQAFWRIVASATRTMASLPEYDVFLHEFHHGQKADSPSGTALSTADQILRNSPTKTTLITETLHRAPESHELHLSSTRGGAVPGTHSVYFDSPSDTIEITHTARSRAGFARWALHVAQWMANKKGWYEIEDFLKNDKWWMTN